MITLYDTSRKAFILVNPHSLDYALPGLQDSTTIVSIRGVEFVVKGSVDFVAGKVNREIDKAYAKSAITNPLGSKVRKITSDKIG